MKERLRLFFCRFIITTVFVVSALCTFGASNAFAANDIITGGTGSCTVDVLGVSDDNALVNTIATWELVSYNCAAGTYLVISETTIGCSDCTIGSYCPGGVFTVEDEYLGINACPDGYTTRTTKSTSESDCVSLEDIPDTNAFYVTTPTLLTGDAFEFDISAGGSFTIDWGDGTTETFDKAVGNKTYSHTYTKSDQYIIKISSQNVTGYSTTDAAISFQCKDERGNDIVEHSLIGISGSLGAVFPSIDGASQPLFTKTFYGCETLSSQIPSGLFNGIVGQPADYMFKQTFDGCSLLTSVSQNLFSGISGTATGLFEGTFANTGLTGDITGLFSGINGMPADYMFSETFLNTKLNTIPATLFAGVTGETDGNIGKYMFKNTFAGTDITAIPETLFSKMTPSEGMFYGTFSYTPLKSIPSHLFLNISGSPKPYLFAYTFKNTKITSISSELFDKISGAPAVAMFAGTFENCSELQTDIPGGLFKNIKGAPVDAMFMKTFSGDEQLYSYIPPELFKGIDSAQFRAGQMEDVFLGSGILEQCPSNMVQYITGFEIDFDSKVSCTFCPANSTVRGEAGATYCECNDGYTVFGEINGSTRVQYNQTCELPSVDFIYSCGNNATSDSVPPSGGRAIIGSDTLIALGNTCKRENYDFANWKIDGTDLVFNPNESFPWDWIIQEGKTKIYFTAQYTPRNYIITYSCDGTERNKVQNVTYGEQYILSDAICSKNGAVQVGWRQSDTQELFPFGHMDTYLFDSNKSFVAEFTSIYTITYSCGDGTGNAPESQGPILQDEEYTPQNNTCTAPAGYSFDGWSVSNTENIVRQPGQMYNYTFWENKTFTAIWKPNCNKITLDATTNGGSGGTGVIYKKTGSGTAYSDDQCNVEISSVTIPTKSRATFTGYYTVAELSGGNQCITPGGAILSTDTCNVMAPTTWYARYDCNSDYTGSGVNISGRCTDDLSTVIYDCGVYGTGSATDYVEIGTTYTIRGNVCTPEYGYGLAYYTIEGANTSVFPGDELVWTYTGETTLRALYKPGNTIYYNCDGGTPYKDTLNTQFVAGGLGAIFAVKSDACPCVRTYQVYDAETLEPYGKDYIYDADAKRQEYVFDGDVIFAPESYIDGCWGSDDDDDDVEGGSFQLHITTENDNENVSLEIAASGKFKIDWGVNEGYEIIERADPGITYEHTYRRAGSYTITISGQATGYSQGSTAFKVWCDPSREGSGGLYAVTGAMGSVFSTLSNGKQPSFQGTFQNCKQLKSVESMLFHGITGQPIPYMFAGTFDNTALEEVPNGLFSGLSGEPVEGLFQATFRSSNVGNIQGNYLFAGIKGAPTERLFMETFANTKLNGIPNGLFDTISGAPADYMFYHTFNNTNLASIPTGLFKNISGGPASHMFEGTFESTKISAIPVGLFDGINNKRAPAPWMFAYTFGGTPITTIPTGLFANVYGAPAQSMFEGTFANTDITSIPNGLFDGINGVPARSMFASTFAGTKITSIPYALFPYVAGTPAQAMYAATFYDTPITYIPADLFAGITGEPAPEMFKQTFEGCNKIATQIPETLFFGINGDLKERSFYRTFHGAVSVDFRYDTLNFVPPKLFEGINPDSATAENNAMRDIFQESNILTKCPSEYRRVKTGFDTWFNTKTRTTYIWNDALNGGVKRACVKCPEHSNQREADEYACECDLGYSKDGKWSGNDDNIPNRIISNADEYCKAVTYNVIYECGSGDGDNYTTYATYGKGTYTIWDNLTSEGEQHCVNKHAGKLIGWQIKNQGYDECSHYDCKKMYTPGEVLDVWPYAANLPNIRFKAVYAPEFTIVTVPGITRFAITIKADGNFVIDWGDGTSDPKGTPWSSAGWIYTHDYEEANSYTIRISGDATAYANLDNAGKESVIDFYRADDIDGVYFSTNKIAEIYGSLGDIFPTLPDGTQPKFERVFENATKITSPIPENLFSGTPDENGNFPVHGQVRRAMFAGAFAYSSIKEIPAGLFRSVSGTAEELFRETFMYCSNLTSIPPELFQTITGRAKSGMFLSTFSNCNGLNTPIPSGLFPSGLVGATSDAPADRLFAYTFAECKNLPGSIPDGLFKNINSTGVAMFMGTFSGCENLSGPIPDDLFAGLSGAPKGSDFSYTFSGCKNLTGPIPGNLFAGLSGAPAPSMFRETFFNCSSLTGQKDGIYAIPADLFAKISGDAQPYMFDGTFDGCGGLIGEIPGNLFENITGAPQEYMFRTTFANTQITKIGQGLFSGISGAPAEGMFAATFENCRNIASQIPEDLFAGINGKLKRSSFNSTFENIGTQFNFKDFDNGCGIYQDDTYSFIPPKLFDNTRISGVTDIQSDMEDLFYNANLSYSCPTRYYRYITGFEDYFYGNVSCSICPVNAVQNPQDDTTCICASGYILSKDLSDQGILYPENDGDCVQNEFTVFYDCNGGSGNPTPASQQVEYGAEFTTAVNTCEREGYDFAGWAVDKDETIIKPVKPENARLAFVWQSNITLQAVWLPIITPVILDSTMYIGETDFRTADTDAAPDRLWSEYSGGWYTDADLENKIDKLDVIPRVNGYLFRGFSQNKTLNQEGPDDMYFVSNGTVNLPGKFGTTDEVTLYAHYKPCTCTLGEGVQSCEVVGTNDNNQCIYEVTCKQYYIGDKTVLGDTRIPAYTAKCDVAPLYKITLDSAYYDSVDDAEALPVTSNASPDTLYIKYSWGWFADAAGVIPVENLTSLPVNNHFVFKGFYTGKAGSGVQVISSDGNLISTSNILNMFTSDATIYAYYEPRQYSIRFDCGISSGTPPDTLLATYGQTIHVPDEGKCQSGICGKFMGWKISDTDLVVQEKEDMQWEYDTDKVLTAIYDTTYTIKYDANNVRASGNAPAAPVACTQGTECLVPENTYSVYGNNFIGWTCTGVNECDTGIILNPGYDLSNFSTCYGDNITLIAQWENSKFNIIYAPNGGVGDNPALTSCEYGTECKVPENPYTYPGHEFVNWKFETDTNQSGLLEPNDDFASLFSTNPKTVTLIAQWDALPYTVVYHANGGTGTMEPSTFIYDQESYLSINKFERPGYTFVGWSTTQEGTSVTYTDGQKVKNLTDEENGVVNLYAVWNIAYTITFDKMGGTGGTDSVTVMYDELPPVIEVPTKAGYDFVGYYDAESMEQATKFYEGNGIPIFKWPYASDGTLYAQYIPKMYHYNYFCSETEVAPEGGDITYGDYLLAAESTCTPPTGYVFDTWLVSGTEDTVKPNNSLLYKYTSDKVLYASFVPGTYTVTFHSNYDEDRTVVETFVYDNAYFLRQQYRRPGSDFVGYATTPDGEVVYKGDAIVSNLTDVVGGNVDLYSIWETLTIPFEYDGNGGTQVVDPIIPTSCSGDEICIAPENPFERPGYEFIGWTCSGHAFCDNGLFAPGTDLRSSIIETISKNEVITMIAQWKPITFTVVYDVDGGNPEIESQTCTYDTECFVSDITPTKPGYSFETWEYVDGANKDLISPSANITNITDVANATISLVAQYAPNTYTITLDPDGGITNQTSISVKYNDVVPNAQVPTRDDYLFMGYYTAKSGAGDQFFDKFGAPVSEIYTLTTDITVYAYWKVLTCTDYDGTVLDRCDDPILSVQEMIDDDVLEYKDTDSYKITNFDKYMRNQRWAVNFPTYGTGTGTITGSAFCGPANTAEYGTKVNGIKEYGSNQNDSIDTQANTGCWCQVGPTDTAKFWVAAGAYTDGATWAENTDACRANCPDFCAQLVATDSEFRTLLYDGKDACPIGTDYKKACCEGEYETAAGTYEDCPVGSWCNNCEINKCDAIAMYTATQGATSPLACGTWLHVGDHTVFMRPNAKMTPIALHVNKRGTIFHANMSTEKPDDGKEKHLKAKVNDVIYYIYDNLLPI